MAYRIGYELLKKGDLDAALSTFEILQQQYPEYAPPFRASGLAYEKLGKVEAARAALERYLELAPSAPDAAKIRARLNDLAR